MKKSVLTVTIASLILAWTSSVAPAAPSGAVLAQATASAPPAAGAIPLGVTVIEMRAIVAGLSAKKDILGKHVYNDQNQDLGAIDDLIITPADQAAYAILSVGGFLGIGARLVAIPTRQLKLASGKFTLPGATKDELTKMPPFVYSH